jgi:N-acetylmuramic acid 6-phosphate etherase
MSRPSPASGEACALVLDLGATWIKGLAVAVDGVAPDPGEPRRWPNPTRDVPDQEGFAFSLEAICHELAGGRRIASLAAATAGEVDAAGRRYLVTAPHLGVMGTNGWQERFHARLGCPFALINDAEAFVLGAAESGLLPVRGNVGAMVIGTGLGFCVVRDGRWWKPGRHLNLLGSVCVPDGNYDRWVSASAFADAAGGDLRAALRDGHRRAERDTYFGAVAAVAATATVLYQLDEILLGGGLADAAEEEGLDLAGEILGRLPALLPCGIARPHVRAVPRANATSLRGLAALALGNLAAEAVRFRSPFSGLHTEQPASPGALEGRPARQVVQALRDAEDESGRRLDGALDAIAGLAERIARAVPRGGRVLYVGAGTSGRLAALDCVEMPCTYGTPNERFVAVVAGGVADAALSIEPDSEEDFSAVPEMVLLQPTARDIVVGISASGSAFYVRSALAFARRRGAFTALIHEGAVEPDLAALNVPLGSGSELVSGSTRMKAGTATKKVLNFLSTTSMVLLGKVRGGFMVDFEGLNEKLRERARRILCEITGVTAAEADVRLGAHGYRLGEALKDLAGAASPPQDLRGNHDPPAAGPA